MSAHSTIIIQLVCLIHCFWLTEGHSSRSLFKRECDELVLGSIKSTIIMRLCDFKHNRLTNGKYLIPAAITSRIKINRSTPKRARYFDENSVTHYDDDNDDETNFPDCFRRKLLVSVSSRAPAIASI